jgi:hypothetical protein
MSIIQVSSKVQNLINRNIKVSPTGRDLEGAA